MSILRMLVGALLACFSAGAWANAEPATERMAAAGVITSVTSITQELSIKISNGTTERQAKMKDPVYAGDKLFTGADQTVIIEFKEQSELVLGPNSSFLVEKFDDTLDGRKSQQTLLHLFYGMARALVKKVYRSDEMFVVKTRDAVMGVRGTEFIASFNSRTNTTELHTMKGQVAMGAKLDSLRDPSKFVMVTAGQMSMMNPGSPLPAAAKTFDPGQFKRELRKISPQFERRVGVVRQTDAKPTEVQGVERRFTRGDGAEAQISDPRDARLTQGNRREENLSRQSGSAPSDRPQTDRRSAERANGLAGNQSAGSTGTVSAPGGATATTPRTSQSSVSQVPNAAVSNRSGVSPTLNESRAMRLPSTPRQNAPTRIDPNQNAPRVIGPINKRTPGSR